WVLTRIEDELFATGPADGDVFAGGTVTGFAPALPGQFAALYVQTGMRARGKGLRDVRVAIKADLVAHKRCAFNLRRGNHDPIHCGTGIEDHHKRRSAHDQPNAGEKPSQVQLALTQ